MRSFFVYLCLAVSLTFLVACGSSSNSNNANNTSPTPPLSGANGSGSGSAGSGSGNGGSGSSGSGSGSSSSSVSYVYTASTSTIMGYGVKSDGSLTALTGSPFAASLAQGSNIVTNGANIYAIAQGQRNLDIFSIDKSSGALNLVNGAAGGTSGDPNWTLALDHTGASLYVGVGIPDETDSISGFTVGSGPDAQHFESW